jgi:UDP-glucose 4-epimerase
MKRILVTGGAGFIGSPVHYQFDPVQTTKTNVHGANR